MRLARRIALGAGRALGFVRRLRPSRDNDAPIVRDDGPRWWTELLDPSVRLVRKAGAESQFVYSSALLAAARVVVQPRLSNPIKRQWPDGLPEDFLREAKAASLDGWSRERTSVLPEAHVLYRAAHQHSIGDLLDRCVRGASVARRVGVTVVCATKRPDCLSAVLENVGVQEGVDVALVLVTNSDRFDLDEVRRRVAIVDFPAKMIHLPGESLGSCLNAGFERADTRFVAKFDDDDLYGRRYLSDAVLAHAYANAAVVGKHSYFAYLEQSDSTIVRFPGNEFSYGSFVAGGTLVVDTERLTSVEFPDVSIGEDGEFLARCVRGGHSVFAADRFNYLQVRGRHNTWRIDDFQFADGADVVSSGRAVHLIEV